MTRPNITPGPWKAEFSTLKQYTSPRVLSKSREVAIAPTNGINSLPWEKAEANARAIAAVPALLEALEQLANDQEVGFIARAALIAAGYQF